MIYVHICICIFIHIHVQFFVYTHMKYTYTHVFSRTLTRVSPRSLWFLPAVVRESFGPGEKDRRGPQGPSVGDGCRVAYFSTFAGLQWMFHDVLNLRRYYYTHIYIYTHMHIQFFGCFESTCTCDFF